jgi:hypothetical protein
VFMICLLDNFQRTTNILVGTHERFLERSFLRLDVINWDGFLLLFLDILSSYSWLLEGAYIWGIGC